MQELRHWSTGHDRLAATTITDPDRTPGFEPRVMWENEHMSRESRRALGMSACAGMAHGLESIKSGHVTIRKRRDAFLLIGLSRQ